MALVASSLETRSQEMERQEAVVILNWNGVQHLERFLPSVVEYTPTSVDIIVADNGSTDGSLELLRSRFEGVKIIELGQNYGFAEGYNRALESLNYQFVILLNSDVRVVEGWCEPLFARLRSDDTIAAVSPKLRSETQPTHFEYAGASGGFIDILGYPFCRGRILQSVEEDRAQYDDLCPVMWVSGAAFACRLSLYKELGGFDSDFFAHMEEIDLCWRFALRGYRVEVVPQSVVYHLGGGTLSVSSPRKTHLNHRNNLAMLYKCAPTGQRLLVAVVRPILDFVAACSYLLKGEWGNFVAVFKAYRDFVAWHPQLSAKRRAIRSQVTTEASGLYRGSIVLKYLLGAKRFEELKLEK